MYVNSQGAKYGYVWFGSNFACVIFFYFFMPEMKGRSLEELDEMFLNRVSVRQFPKYECALRQDAANDVLMREEEERKIKEVTSTHTEEVEGQKN